MEILERQTHSRSTKRFRKKLTSKFRFVSWPAGAFNWNAISSCWSRRSTCNGDTARCRIELKWITEFYLSLLSVCNVEHWKVKVRKWGETNWWTVFESNTVMFEMESIIFWCFPKQGSSLDRGWKQNRSLTRFIHILKQKRRSNSTEMDFLILQIPH